MGRWDNKGADFSDLKGLVIAEIRGMAQGSDRVVFITECGRTFFMEHHQDCCESVYLSDVVGDVEDLIGSPILMAEESIRDDAPVSKSDEEYGIFQWTFYKLATIKGYVDLRWYGTSNGYYGVGVDFDEFVAKTPEPKVLPPEEDLSFWEFRP